MKYLDSKPFNIAVSDATEHRPQVVENGGPATRIPDDAKCPSGRHNTRLTECYCPVLIKMPDGTLMQYHRQPPDSPIFKGLDRK